eukprot:6491353-Amphidinium_carterae.5
MAYIDDLLVVGDKATTQPFLQQFQQHLELKHTSQLTKTTPLEFLGTTLELQDDGAIHLSFAPQYYNKILKAYNMDKCNPSTTPGNKKNRQLQLKRLTMNNTQCSGQLRDNSYESHNCKRTFHLLCSGTSRVQRTTHYKVSLAPKAQHNEQGQITVSLYSHADSDWALQYNKKEHK